MNCQNYLVCFRNLSECGFQKKIALVFEKQIYYLSEAEQEFSNFLPHCFPTLLFNTNLPTTPP